MRSYRFIIAICMALVSLVGGVSAQTSDAANHMSALQQDVIQHIGCDNAACTAALQRLLDYYEERYTAQSPQYAECVLWSAMICHQSHDRKQCKQLLTKSDELFKKYGPGPFYGRDTINEIFRLDLLTAIEEDLERDYNAVKYAQRAKKLKKAFFGEDSEVVLNATLDLSKLYASRFRDIKSSHTHTEAYNAYVALIREKFCALSDIGRETYWDTAIRYIHKTTSLAYGKGKPQAWRNRSFSMETYNALLLSKGLLLNVSTGFESFVEEYGNDKAVDLLNQKNELLSKGGSRAAVDSIDYAIIAAMERDDIRYTIPELNISWRDVQANLQEDDLAIEFYRTATKEYGAVLLRKKWKQPKLISLKDHISYEKNIYLLDDALRICKDSMQTIKGYDELYWRVGKVIWDDRIVAHFPRTDKGKVYFSADGLLQVVGIEYLPFIEPTDDRYITMSDVYNINRLSSTRILAMNSDTNNDLTATLFGGLAYRMTDKSMTAEAKKHPRHRGVDYTQPYSRESASEYIEPLPNTLKEVDEISKVINNNRGNAQKYVEESGVEEAFKSLSGDSPQILHIATHGFYIPQSADGAVELNEMDNSLKRTGLLLAGAHRAYIKHERPQKAEDGILSAYEISQLDLNMVELAVLSACETGLGDITYDGVAGLQRGFKMAGTKSLLMSLWKVDDQATYFLMTEFYRNWIELKMDKTLALKRAQHSLRTHKEHPEWRSPKFWAAFILLDDYQK